MTDDRKYREFALKNRYGMDEESAEKLRKFNEEQTDWFTECKNCGLRREGTLAELRLACPKCGGVNG